MSAKRVVAASALAPGRPEDLWALLSDPRRFVEWADLTREVLRADEPLGLGGVYVERNRLLGPVSTTVTYTVVELDEPHRQVHRAEGPVLAASMAFFVELAPVASPPAPGLAATRVRVGLRYAPALGPLGVLPDALVLRRSLQRDFERTARNVAALAAREYAAGA